MNKREFKQFVGNVYYFRRIVKGENRYELCFEPCRMGFDVALYQRTQDNHLRLLADKVCTELAGYEEDKFGEKERSDMAWDEAILLSKNLLRDYAKA
jgi:hypothetical protein